MLTLENWSASVAASLVVRRKMHFRITSPRLAPPISGEKTALICRPTDRPVTLGGLLERETERRCALLPGAHDL